MKWRRARPAPFGSVNAAMALTRSQRIELASDPQLWMDVLPLLLERFSGECQTFCVTGQTVDLRPCLRQQSDDPQIDAASDDSTAQCFDVSPVGGHGGNRRASPNCCSRTPVAACCNAVNATSYSRSTPQGCSGLMEPI